ncbi:prostamide/prostaglandin F synthase-like [Gossypium australe]|uniref:Prostamide/prostaglandin F synthase-like n=1 Tax=Gossypium australe TaxID=47621 RepID=A0A5B6UTZ0_9ROSI|nr:prostamide/prostaglandin F synthase-like [Gossypium australe]
MLVNEIGKISTILRLFTSNNGANNSGVVGKASASEFSADIGDVLGDVAIFTAADQPVFLKDLWDQNQGIAVVALLRHFGCPCWYSLDWEFIYYLFIYCLPFPMDCLYADPNREHSPFQAYDILGLYYGFGRTFFNPASVHLISILCSVLFSIFQISTKVFSRFESLQKAVKNYTIEATPDETSSVLQQGGMLVFKGKQPAFVHL